MISKCDVPDIDSLMSEWKVDCKFDDQHLDDESLRTANLHQKYLDYLTRLKYQIFKLDRQLLETRRIRTRYYNGQLTKDELTTFRWEQYQYKTPMKSELERLLESDPYILRIEEEMSDFKHRFEYCEEVLRTIRDRNFQVKHAIEWKKFQAGF